MPTPRIIVILADHHVPFHVTAQGRVMAHADYIDAQGRSAVEHTDVTGFNDCRLAAWLGY